LPASEGYIRQVVPLTDDLDKLSAALFALTTSGGDEYCGQVIDEAITRLDWSKEAGGYKAIFIAGNEPFTQGPIDYRSACKRAIEKGIVVNTIHCGNSRAGIDGMWPDGAKLAEGESFNIDQDRAVVQVRCPQDEIIIKLNAELNKTYLWYGSEEYRCANAANQLAQDENARSAGPAGLAERVLIKGSAVYCNAKRDLVDALKEDPDALAKLKDEELPEAIRGKKPAERQGYVQAIATKRADLQAQLGKLATERDQYLAEVRSRSGAQPAAGATLADVVVPALQRQLSTSGFETAPASR
jgi:hypothetical protein